jgi:hypothetical protein
MAKPRPQVPAAIVARLRAACLRLPEGYEEAAWVGTRWCVRKKTFAHVLMIAEGWPPVYARAAGNDGPLCVVTFQSPGRAIDPHTYKQTPYFCPPWQPNIVGRVLDARTDWDDAARELAVSYCMLAPKALAEQVRRRLAAAPLALPPSLKARRKRRSRLPSALEREG